MEEIIFRFPHLAEQIFEELDSHSLVKCKKTSRTWNEFIDSEKFYYYRIIKDYTNCSDGLMKRLVKNKGAAFNLVSDLKKVFKKFPKGTRQNNLYLKNWGFTPLHIGKSNHHVKCSPPDDHKII